LSEEVFVQTFPLSHYLSYWSLMFKSFSVNSYWWREALGIP